MPNKVKKKKTWKISSQVCGFVLSFCCAKVPEFLSWQKWLTDVYE